MVVVDFVVCFGGGVIHSHTFIYTRRTVASQQVESNTEIVKIPHVSADPWSDCVMRQDGVTGWWLMGG